MASRSANCCSKARNARDRARASSAARAQHVGLADPVFRCGTWWYGTSLNGLEVTMMMLFLGRRRGSGRAGSGEGPSVRGAREWREARSAPELLQGRVTEAGHEVIVDHPGRLHERVDDRRPHELEAAASADPCSAHPIPRCARARRVRLPLVLQRRAVDEAPRRRRSCRTSSCTVEKRIRVLDRRRDLQLVADDAGFASSLSTRFAV